MPLWHLFPPWLSKIKVEVQGFKTMGPQVSVASLMLMTSKFHSLSLGISFTYMAPTNQREHGYFSFCNFLTNSLHLKFRRKKKEATKQHLSKGSQQTQVEGVLCREWGAERRHAQTRRARCRAASRCKAWGLKQRDTDVSPKPDRTYCLGLTSPAEPARKSQETARQSANVHQSSGLSIDHHANICFCFPKL